MSRCRTLVVGLVVAGAALPAAPAFAARYSFGSRPLHKGMHGHDVRVLQGFLTRVGIQTDVDGQFGSVTKRHVKKWERSASLVPNGYVSKRDAALLRGQVQSGATVFQAEPDNPVVAPGEKATLGDDGKAIAPADAPEAVQEAIAAANRIVGKPYKYGGGHGKWEDSGYDCSGSVSYALHGAGLLKVPMTSGEFESYGDAGKGQWITIYGNAGHAYAVIAGLRFDTGWIGGGHGPRWSTQMRPSSGYVARHPDGL